MKTAEDAEGIEEIRGALDSLDALGQCLSFWFGFLRPPRALRFWFGANIL